MKTKIPVFLIALSLALSLTIACSKGASDAQISSQVQSKLAADGNIQNKQIGVQSANGVVTLSGIVATDIERASAANDAATIPVVKTVINNLQVNPQAAQQTAPPPAQTASAAAPMPVEPPRTESGAARRYSPPVRSSGRSAATPRYNPPPAMASSAPVDRTVVTQPMPPAQTTANEAAANVATSAPAPPPKPATVTIPDGTDIAIRLIDPLDSEKNQAGDSFHATLASPIMVGDQVVVPQGADVEGRVVEAKNAAHFSGASSLTVELTRLMVNGKTYSLQTDQWSKQGTARGKNTAAKVGGGAAIGAIIGGIAGGGKGAAIGAGVGAGAGTGVQAATRGEQIRLGPEAELNFRLQNALTVTPSAKRNRE